tara:strand:- start:105 stop:512 length:408 start_codon:yes stop_codon:yes gene_type:complete
MEVQKSVLVKVFAEQVEELYLDMLKVYPKHINIKTGLTIVQQLKRFNPKLMIRSYNEAVNTRYYDVIVRGDIDFFMNKNYIEDCKRSGMDTSEARSQADWIETIKELARTLENDNQKKLIKYFQNFSRICNMYYS